MNLSNIFPVIMHGASYFYTKRRTHMTDNELLLSISEIMDKKIYPISNRLTNIELTLENNIVPRLQNIESCYTSTYDRYKNGVDQIEQLRADMDIVKQVLREHSETLRKIS